MLGIIPHGEGLRRLASLVMVMDLPTHAKIPDGGSVEANHRIANNLALIAGLVRFQARKMPQESLLPAQDVRAWLQQISLRIDTVGRLHRLLTDNDGQATVDLFTYLREIADAALLALSMDGQTEILIDLEPNCVIPAKQASAVGLAVGDRTRLNMLTRPEYRERLVLHRGMAETAAWSLKWQTMG